MSTGSETQTSPAEDLSALVDGELHEAGVALACGRWRHDASSRATWHAYQLIGDVLRSEDLASDAASDAAFLTALRGRLAAEPTILAPQPIVVAAPASSGVGPMARRRRWAWAGPSAVAAGFVAVAGVLVVTRNAAPPVVEQAAAGPAVAPAVVTPARAVAAVAVPAAEPQSLVATGQVIRDAGLDRYLAAHKHFAGSAALGVPSALLRNATVDAAGR